MPSPGYESTALLTGYPSFPARRMAELVVQREPKTLLYCVVRKDLAKPATELADMLPQDQRARLVMVEGDAAAMDMGLSGREFREVSARIDRIFHFAQVTYMDAEPALARYVNVQGIKEALEMGREAPNLRCIVHLSTASVSGLQTGLVREQDLGSHAGYRTVIEETKAHAERIARRAMSGLPIVVLRPSLIIGDSESGEVDRFDGPYPLILLILSSPAKSSVPLPIRGDLPLNLVPIDFVVSAAHTIASDPRAPGRTIHLVDPSPLPAKRVFELVAHAAGRKSPRGFVPSYVARSLLRAPGIERVVKSPRGFLEMLTTNVRYDAHNAEELLRGTGVLCPPFEAYVDRVVTYVKTRIREQQRREDYETQIADDPLS